MPLLSMLAKFVYDKFLIDKKKRSYAHKQKSKKKLWKKIRLMEFRWSMMSISFLRKLKVAL